MVTFVKYCEQRRLEEGMFDQAKEMAGKYANKAMHVAGNHFDDFMGNFGMALDDKINAKKKAEAQAVIDKSKQDVMNIRMKQAKLDQEREERAEIERAARDQYWKSKENHIDDKDRNSQYSYLSKIRL